MAFDYGCPSEQVTGHFGNNLKLWPTTGECTGLVDADAIPYVVGYTSDIQQYLKMQRAPEPLESEIFKDKCDHANYLLNSWVEAAGCDSALLYLTDGASNFRLDIGKQRIYKGQRVSDKPPFFYEIKQWLIDYHGAIMSDCCEADDEISIEAWRRHLRFEAELWTPVHRKFCGFVVISKDKDLKIIPGSHCPPDGQKIWVDPRGELLPKWKETEVTAYEYWPLFSGEPINPKHCHVIQMYGGEISVMTYDELDCPKVKWQMDHVWRVKDMNGKTIAQDRYIRGKNQGKGKFKRMNMGKKKSQVMDKLLGNGIKFFYAQILTGDAVDNYPGLPGCGPTKAFAILDGAESEWELFHRCLEAYRVQYGNEAHDMLREQGQLAWMQTQKGELWEPPLQSSSAQSYPR